MEDCLVLQNYSGLDFEIHRFSENPIFISVNMSSREEWRKLLFIFLFTLVEFPQSLYVPRQMRGYKEKKNINTVPYKVQLK